MSTNLCPDQLALLLAPSRTGVVSDRRGYGRRSGRVAGWVGGAKMQRQVRGNLIDPARASGRGTVRVLLVLGRSGRFPEAPEALSARGFKFTLPLRFPP